MKSGSTCNFLLNFDLKVFNTSVKQAAAESGFLVKNLVAIDIVNWYKGVKYAKFVLYSL